MDAFRYTFFAQDVIFGSGSVAQLAEACEQAGWRRIMLCTTERFRARGHLAPIEAALGERLVATFERVQPHVPESQVAEATVLAAERQVDAVIGLGGGSAIGTAKAVAAALDEQRADQSPVAVIAIPTTYAGSEMTPVYGVTRQVDGVARKMTVTNPKAAPRLTIYDPLLTLDLPPRMTAGTGINAVAHCIEALYSIKRNPLSSAAALAGLRSIAHALPRCYAAGDDVEARGEMLSGSFLAGTALSNVAMGLHHGICHVLGGTTGVAHGDANSVMLAHVMRFNLNTTAPQLAQAAEAMGIDISSMSAEEAAEAAAQRVDELVIEMQLPRRLRDLGIREEQLPELAQLAFANRTVQNNPKPISDAAQLEALLREAW